jgi:hypothetical protein
VFMPRRTVLTAFAAFIAFSVTSPAFGAIIYHGKLQWGNDAFDGTALFKFAVVDRTCNKTYRSNDGSSTAGDQPRGSVSIRVVKGNYSVSLGESNSLNTGSSEPVYLRVWCSIAGQPFQKFADQRIVLNGARNIVGVVSYVGNA